MSLQAEPKDFIKACDCREEMRKYFKDKSYQKVIDFGEQGMQASDDKDISFDVMFMLYSSLLVGKVIKLDGTLCSTGEFGGRLNQELKQLKEEKETADVTAGKFVLSLTGLLLGLIPIAFILFFLPMESWMQEHLYNVFLVIGAIIGIIGLVAGGLGGLFGTVVVVAFLGWAVSELIPLKVGAWILRILLSAFVALLFYFIFQDGVSRNYKAFYGNEQQRKQRYLDHRFQIQTYIEAIQENLKDLKSSVMSHDATVQAWYEGKGDFDKDNLKTAHKGLTAYYDAALRKCRE